MIFKQYKTLQANQQKSSPLKLNENLTYSKFELTGFTVVALASCLLPLYSLVSIYVCVCSIFAIQSMYVSVWYVLVHTRSKISMSMIIYILYIYIIYKNKGADGFSFILCTFFASERKTFEEVSNRREAEFSSLLSFSFSFSFAFSFSVHILFSLHRTSPQKPKHCYLAYIFVRK